MHQETFIGGVYYPSVTTVLGITPKPYLDRWYEKHPVWAPRKVAAANGIGTAFHRIVESVINCDGDPGAILCPNRRIGAMAHVWYGWAKWVDAVIDHTELRVISPTYRYSGTLDAVGMLDGEPCVFDWKTSSGIYEDMGLQLSAYAFAYEEMTGVPVRKGLIVLVSKDKPKHKLTVKEYTLDKRLFNKFLNRLEEFRAVFCAPAGNQ